MFEHVHAALRRIQRDVAQLLDATEIIGICQDVGYRFRQRVLDPVTTIHLFVIQILNGNFAMARLMDFTDRVFSEAAYCKARCRLPLKVLETLLQRVGKALRPAKTEKGTQLEWHLRLWSCGVSTYTSVGYVLDSVRHAAVTVIPRQRAPRTLGREVFCHKTPRPLGGS